MLGCGGILGNLEGRLKAWRNRGRPSLTQRMKRVATIPGTAISYTLSTSWNTSCTEAFPDLWTGLGPCAGHPIRLPSRLELLV